MRPRIYISNGCIKVQPSNIEILKKELRYWHREFEVKNFRKVITGEYRKLYEVVTEVDERNGEPVQRFVTMPGFANKIKSLLPDSEIIDLRTKLPEPNYALAFKGLRDYQYEGAYALLNSRGGIAACFTAYGKTHLMAAILSAFDHEGLKSMGTPLSVLATPGRDVTLKNYEDIKELLPDREVGLVMGNKLIPSDDIIVCTLESMHKLNREEVAILIVDEVHAAGSALRSSMILGCRNAYKFGVSATPTGRFDGSDKVVTGLFGPVVYRIGFKEGVEKGAVVPIHVCWLPAPEPDVGMDRYLGYKTREGKYSRAILNNRGRNKMIGDIFKLVDPDMQSMCLTKTVEHLDYILGYCPDSVQYCHGGGSKNTVAKCVNVGNITKQDRQRIYEGLKNNEIKQLVSTMIYKQGVNFPSLELIINASGGSSKILNQQIPGRPCRKEPGKDVAYVVDFYHPWDVYKEDGKEKPGPFKSEDTSRKNTYKKLGFKQTAYARVEDLPFIKKENEN